MKTCNYNLDKEEIKPREIKLKNPLIYEIIKKYVASIKLENM